MVIQAEMLKKHTLVMIVHIHSDFLDGLNKADRFRKIDEWLEEHGVEDSKVAIVYVTGCSLANVIGRTNLMITGRR